MSTNVDENTGVSDKSERQILYLTYRGMPAHPTTNKRMTQTAAAALAGVDTNTVTRWRKTDAQFAARERQVRAEGISRARETAKAGASALITSSLYTLTQLLRKSTTPEHVRAHIAIKVLEWVGVSEPVQVELGGDPWGNLMNQLIDLGHNGDEDEGDSDA